MKPANHYASTVTIPDYVEIAIANLSRHDRYNLADDLMESIRDRQWSAVKPQVLPVNALKWLSAQAADTFKDLHHWLSNELI